MGDWFATQSTPTPLVIPSAIQACAWCYGSGQYLEALDGDRRHEYLPVLCQGCLGDGKRHAIS
jgi:hypothetical protein